MTTAAAAVVASPARPRLLSEAITHLRTKCHTERYHSFDDACERQGFQDQLLKWYDEHQREMPWRVKSGVGNGVLDTEMSFGSEKENIDEEQSAQRAYEVWISEVMLQQTQVATVIPYYEKWLSKWPTIHDLAKADPESVHQIWSGLGYYSRARRLHEAAKLVVSDFGGRLPRDPVILQKQVPGIGPYTAGAICSIAYNIPAPLVDGNVVRVLSRVRAIASDPKAKDSILLHWSLAKEILHSNRPGHFNQALMDLGATICTPVAAPDCPSCPVKDHCRAFAESKAVKIIAQDRLFSNTTTPTTDTEKDETCNLCPPLEDMEDAGVKRYPAKSKKKAPRNEVCAVCIVETQPAVDSEEPLFLVVQGPKSGLLANLWDFPTVPLGPSSTSKNEPAVGPQKGVKRPRSKSTKPPADTAIDTEALQADYEGRKITTDTFLRDTFGYTLSPNADSQWQIVDRTNLGSTMHLFSHIRRVMAVEHIRVKLGSDPAVADTTRAVQWHTQSALLAGVVAVPSTLKKSLLLLDAARAGKLPAKVKAASVGVAGVQGVKKVVITKRKKASGKSTKSVVEEEEESELAESESDVASDKDDSGTDTPTSQDMSIDGPGPDTDDKSSRPTSKEATPRKTTRRAAAIAADKSNRRLTSYFQSRD
ncbi:DNA glycosylase [Phlyctochytrium arcticum]|nr:DNA glycosylase [Phlyctochytrium arcticum]